MPHFIERRLLLRDPSRRQEFIAKILNAQQLILSNLKNDISDVGSIADLVLVFLVHLIFIFLTR